MCRRCGESDKRGSTRDRARRRNWIMSTFGTGDAVPCWLCDRPLNRYTMQVDRLAPQGTYARWNVRPACGPCNRSRSTPPIPEGCRYG